MQKIYPLILKKLSTAYQVETTNKSMLVKHEDGVK